MSYFPKAILPRLVVVSLLMPLLAACNFTMNQNSAMESVVQSAPLNNGKALSIGYKSPDAAAGCQLINETSRNWALAQSVGEVKFGGGRQVLQEEAVGSVNQRPQDGINYVALMIPNETALGAVDLTVGQQAKTSYFRCANPPQPH